MWLRTLVTAVSTAAALAGADAAAQDALSPTERGWIEAAGPVLAAARTWTLPLDVVVQPQPNRGESPLAIGLLRGRCKLVMTLRGETGRLAPGVDTGLDAPRIEAMFAHEVAHCWRHVQGAWHVLPAGFTEHAAPVGGTTALAALERDMRATRREEGFADLVALAWTAERHPARYRQVHEWLSALRADQPPDDAHHDTRLWLALARDPGVFARGGSVFERARSVWIDGLASEAD